MLPGSGRFVAVLSNGGKLTGDFLPAPPLGATGFSVTFLPLSPDANTDEATKLILNRAGDVIMFVICGITQNFS